MVKKETLNSASYKVSNAEDEGRKYDITANATLNTEKFTGLDSGQVRKDGNPVADFNCSEGSFWCNIYGADTDRQEVIEAIFDFYEACKELTC